MELKTKQRNPPGLVADINKDKYNFSHPLQRPKNQWSNLMKAELIDSVLRDYSIDPVTIVISTVDEFGETKDLNNAVIDGVQRLTTFAAFFYNESLADEPFIIAGNSYLPSEYLHGKNTKNLTN